MEQELLYPKHFERELTGWHTRDTSERKVKGENRDAKRRFAEYYGCHIVTKNVPLPPLKSTPLPKQPWEEVTVDLMGRLQSGEHLLVLVDYNSRWMTVDVIRTTCSKTIIDCLDAQFARHGLPKGLHTDNSSNLVSKEVEDYRNEMGIEYRFVGEISERGHTIVYLIT